MKEEDTKSSVKVVIGLGSNHGDRYASLNRAINCLSQVLENFRCSNFYETPAIGQNTSGTYLNAVISADTTLPMQELDGLLKQLEIEAGRDEMARRRGEVPLDLDIVIYADTIVRPRDYAQSFFRIGYWQLS